MPAESFARRTAKGLLRPIRNGRTYGFLQALSVIRDIRSGTFSEPEMDLIPKTVLPGETAIDIGANLGMYVPALSRAVGAGGRVYAFEPIPYTVATLRRVVRLLRLKNVVVRGEGCAEQYGMTSFNVPVQGSGALMTGQAHVADRNDDRPGSETQVRWEHKTTVHGNVVALDDCFPDLDRLSLIKCDIEGAELHALRGATQLIERNHPIVICEINPWFLDGLGISLNELLEFFASRDYTMYRMDETTRKLRRVMEPGEIEEDNYVFVNPDRLPRISAFVTNDQATSV